MTVTSSDDALEALLARATEAEQQEFKEAGTIARTLTPDAIGDLAAQAAAESPAFVELRDTVEMLRDTVEMLAGSSPPGFDPAADADADEDEDEADVDLGPLLATDFEPEPDGLPVEGDAGEFDPTLLPSKSDEGFDFDDSEPLEVKAWGACPECGSTGRDEYADGSARCEDCGTPLPESKADDEMEGIELLDETKGVVLAEIELLQARREALER